MILLIQLLITIGLTVLYAINISFTFALLDIVKVFLVFGLIFLIMTIVVLLTFIVMIYISEKTDEKCLIKHKIYNQYNYYIFNFLYRVKPVIIGKENLPKNNNFVVYSNHIEYTDPLYIKQVYKNYPLAYVAKEELYKYPVLKNILRGTGCLPISRKIGDRQALQAILAAIKSVKNGQPMGIFPEGTRSHTNIMGEFKSGAFKLAQKAEADISLVVLYNMHKTIDIFKFLKVKVYLKVLPIITYDEYKDLDTQELSKLVYDKINEELQTFKEM